LLFNEGYYSSSQITTIRKDLCIEAMRLNYLLVENELTNTGTANALLSLMCFHASRFDARTDQLGQIILYDEQDTTLWDHELIKLGANYLDIAFKDVTKTKYHLEAGIAFCHTQQEDCKKKWETILQLYNQLLQIEYSPIIALNQGQRQARGHIGGQKIARVR
jgi:RNA polymerase sigma-70 factor (ECF subfamily)